jgi:RNA polymerase sigma-70 factor (ECF subfamily)
VTDDALIALAQHGDRAAYDMLVGRYRELAWKTALVLLRSPEDAEEAMQTAMLKAWLHLGSFRSGSPFRPWLLRIVGNESRNLAMARTRRWKRVVGVPDDDVLPDPSPRLDDLLIVEERSRALLQAIDRLPLRDREVLHARYVLDLGEQEIAAVLEIRPGTVKSRLHRAIERLRLQARDDQDIWP